jgi:hypothetical protein
MYASLAANDSYPSLPVACQTLRTLPLIFGDFPVFILPILTIFYHLGWIQW